MKGKASEIKHKITIKVSDTFGRPIKGCLVAIYNYEEGWATTYSTNEQEQVSCELLGGSYDLEVSKNGYRRYNRSINVPPRRELNVTVLYHEQS